MRNSKLSPTRSREKSRFDFLFVLNSRDLYTPELHHSSGTSSTTSTSTTTTIEKRQYYKEASKRGITRVYSTHAQS